MAINRFVGIGRRTDAIRRLIKDKDVTSESVLLRLCRILGGVGGAGLTPEI